MLPKKQRVPQDLFPGPKTPKILISGHFFSISYTKTPSPARVSVVVSKKVHNQASDRNLLRRRVYALFTDILISQSTGILVVYAKKTPKKPTFRDIEVEIRNLLSKIPFLFDKRSTS